MTACMTNPPFYDLEEIISEGGHAVCTGTNTEMRTLGGEVAFIAAMILDSLVMQRAGCRWYTCMVGKKASIKTLRALLRDAGVPIVHSTRFAQGRTMRWGLAWSFYEDSPPLSVYTKEAAGRKKSKTIAVVSSALRSTQLPSEKGEGEDSQVAIVQQRVQLAYDEIEKRHRSSSVHVDRTPDNEDEDEDEEGHVCCRISVGPDRTLLYLVRIRVLPKDEEEAVVVEVELEQSSECPVALAQALSMQGVLATLEQHLQRNNRSWRRELGRASSEGREK